MPVRDTIPPVELASDRRTVVPAEPAADLETVARGVLLDLLRDGGAALREELGKPQAAGGGGGVDRFGRVIATLALASVIAMGISHELGSSTYRDTILELIDVLRKAHPEQAPELLEAERGMRD